MAALEVLARIQKHRATIGNHVYTGISKTTEEQLDLFGALVSMAIYFDPAVVNKTDPGSGD